jgi:hypothetical protein
MPGEMEILLAPNGEEIKLQWRRGGIAFSKPIKLKASVLRNRSAEVRAALSAMTEYIRRNPKLKEEFDPRWDNYRSVFQRIRNAGKALRAAILRQEQSPNAQALEAALMAMPQGASLRIHCSDEEVTFPFGFVCDDSRPGDDLTMERSVKDFGRFWLSRFKISMVVEGSDYAESALNINPDTLRALYALHKTELEKSAEDLGADLEKLKQLLKVRVGDHYDWDSVTSAWQQIDTPDSIVFVFSHSDGDHLTLDGESKIESLQFRDMLEKRTSSGATLLILNCCLSAAGAEGASLLSAVARPGFCGLVGTEAEILNTTALGCGTRLLWELCAMGVALGDAFDALQQDPRLFPLNLFYTCYADRSFKLSAPMSFEPVAA